MMQHWSESPISDIYFQSRFGAMRADIFRYCILFDKGGYYFDIGKGLSSQITSLHDASSSALISFEKNPVPSDWPDSNLKFSRNLVLQWGFGFEKKHKILDMQIKRIIQNYPKYLSKKFANPKLAILELTGPLAFTQSVRDFLESSSSIDLTQAGIDFNNTGIFALPGAGSRLLQFPSYGQAVNQSLFLS
jgi:mannosyltransferase OCH1-like enzyme